MQTKINEKSRKLQTAKSLAGKLRIQQLRQLLLAGK
jgi:hypothetical protein